MSGFHPIGRDKVYWELSANRNNVTGTEEINDVGTSDTNEMRQWLNTTGKRITITHIKFFQDDNNADSYILRFYKNTNERATVDFNTPEQTLTIPFADTLSKTQVLIQLPYVIYVDPGESIGSTIMITGGAGDETNTTLVGYTRGAASNPSQR
jgi:hypothetical protein